MIGRIYDPNQGLTEGDLRPLYVPLYAIGAVFHPVEPPLGAYADPLDAARVCARNLRTAFADIAGGMRMLRALCEHNDVEFSGEVVDADLLRLTAAELDSAIRAQSATIEHLLERPGRDALIRIMGARMRLDEHGVLVADETAAPEPERLEHTRAGQTGKLDGWARDPGMTMIFMLKTFIEQIERMTGSPIADEELDRAIAFLQDVRARHAPTAEEEAEP